MKPSRRTQPYRKGARPPGRALAAMLAGKPMNGRNPMDVKRRAQKHRRRRGGALARALAQVRY